MSEFISLGDAIDRFLKKYNLKDEVLIQEIITNWESLVGKPIAQHTEKIWFERETLFIKVDGAAWRNELSMARLRIRNLINQKVGKELVKEVKVI
jgi:predicted nucleic acid-binding Zn ribbon protein